MHIHVITTIPVHTLAIALYSERCISETAIYIDLHAIHRWYISILNNLIGLID